MCAVASDDKSNNAATRTTSCWALSPSKRTSRKSLALALHKKQKQTATRGLANHLSRSQGFMLPKSITLDEKVEEATRTINVSISEDEELVSCLKHSNNNNNHTTTTKKQRRVHFAKGDCFEPPLVVVASLPPAALTEQETKDTFYSYREITKGTARAKATARKQDRHVEKCLEYLSGVRSQYQVKGKEWSHSQALQYYYSRRLPEEETEGGESTLRGLEGIIATKIVDKRKDFIQYILRLQEVMMETAEEEHHLTKTSTLVQTLTHQKKQPADVRLAQEAYRASSAHRCFALRLAKADRAVVVKQYSMRDNSSASGSASSAE